MYLFYISIRPTYWPETIQQNSTLSDIVPVLAAISLFPVVGRGFNHLPTYTMCSEISCNVKLNVYLAMKIPDCVSFVSG